MQRRKFKTDSKHAPTFDIRNGAENRDSDMPFRLVKPKRVRFESPRVDNANDHVSYRQNKTTESPRSNQPKTSEFAYFRKVKSNAVHAHSCSLPKLKERLKGSQINSNTRGTSGEFATLKPANKKLKLSGTGGSAELFEHYHSVPENDASHIVRTEDEHKKNYAGPSFSSESAVTPVVKSWYNSPLNEPSENSDFPEKQCPDKGTFSAKRHRLRQWAAQTLSSDVENFHPKGLDLVSSLLSRLLPKDNKNEDSSGSTDKKGKSPDIHDSTNNAIRLDISHSRDWDKDGQGNCAGRLNEIVLSERETSVFLLPSPNYDSQIHFQDDIFYLNRRWRSRLARSSDITWNDSSLFLPYERCRYSEPNYLNDMDDLHEHARKGDHIGLLEWDFKSDSNRLNYIITHDAEKYSLATPWNFERQIHLNDVSERKIMLSSSEDDYLEEYMMPRFNSTIHVTSDFDFAFRPHLAELEHAVAEPMQSSLAKPSTSNITFCYGNNRDRLMDNFMDLNPCADYWMKSLSASNLYSPSNFHARRFPEIEHRSSSGETFMGMSQDRYFNLRTLLDSYIECPLLLDVVKDEESAKESSFCDGDYNGFSVLNR